MHVISKLLESNNKNVSKIHKNQGKKLQNFFFKNPYRNCITSHNPDELIFHFLIHILNSENLSDSYPEKSLLIIRVNFAKPENINCTGYTLPFELLCRDFDSLELSNLDRDFTIKRLRDSAFSLYKDTGKILEKNLP